MVLTRCRLMALALMLLDGAHLMPLDSARSDAAWWRSCVPLTQLLFRCAIRPFCVFPLTKDTQCLDFRLCWLVVMKYGLELKLLQLNPHTLSWRTVVLFSYELLKMASIRSPHPFEGPLISHNSLFNPTRMDQMFKLKLLLHLALILCVLLYCC